jgi:hypothetical protein
MLGERIDSRPLLRLVKVSQGAWLRPDIRTPDAAPARLPAPYWASGPRRGGLRRSTVRVTLREAYRRRARRTEAYLPAAIVDRIAARRPEPVAQAVLSAPTPRERAPLLRRAADFLSQVFKPEG